jgi:hypothetical protein
MVDKERRYRKLIERSKGVSRNLAIPVNRAKEFQLRALKRLLTKAKQTEFGRAYGFNEILYAGKVYEAFKANVPAGDYSAMLPWWEKARTGQADVSWPGKIEHFALSSGTSDGASKYIPVSQEMVKAIRRASMRQVLSIARTDMPKDHMTKHWLMIGGSTSLNYNGIYYAGDLSGITTSKIPPIFQRVSKPEPDIKASSDWQEKIERITQEAKNWDVSMVAGVPAWIQLLFKNIIEHYNLNNIHDIWPNLEVYIHGGVSIKPYKSGINALLGKPIKYFETYLASEGFIAFQNREKSEGGMRLLLRNGIFYEFVPFNRNNFDENYQLKPNPEAYPIWEVEENKEYALLISTCSGAWRYLIGDTVKFTNLKRKEIIITGRTKHFISLVGEHLSVDNMTEAVSQLAQELNEDFEEFTMAGTKADELFGHRWYIGTNNPDLVGKDYSVQLDNYLKTLNDDYGVERDHALHKVQVDLIPIEWFLEWMRLNGKEGSQHKFPRVMKGKTYENWQDFLATKGMERSVPAQ